MPAGDYRMKTLSECGVLAAPPACRLPADRPGAACARGAVSRSDVNTTRRPSGVQPRTASSPDDRSISIASAAGITYTSVLSQRYW
jgi:hypothetical protein